MVGLVPTSACLSKERKFNTPPNFSWFGYAQKDDPGGELHHQALFRNNGNNAGAGMTSSLQWLQAKKNHKDDPLFQELSVWADDDNNPSEGEEGEQPEPQRKAEQQQEQERPTDEALLVTSDLESLAPIAPEQRTWGALHFAAIWMALAISVPTYMIGASLLLAGLNWWQASLTIMLGNLICLVPLVLNGEAGARYGISFPVFLRSSFGTRGARVAALARGAIGVGWFGLQLYVGGMALAQVFVAVLPSLQGSPSLGSFIGLNVVEAFSLALFFAVTVVFLWMGIQTIKVLQVITAPLLVLAGVALLAWALVETGLPRILEATYEMQEEEGELDGKGNGGLSWLLGTFGPAVSAVVGGWSTMALNILDFTRYARSQRDQALGQALGLPLPMTAFALVGMATTAASYDLYGEAIWEPAAVFATFSNRAAVALASLLLAVAVMAANLTANVVSPANDFANLWPQKLSFKAGGLITCGLGVAIMPWRIFADAHSFVFGWLIGGSALLGAVGGVMLCDYYLLKRRRLDVRQLYKECGVDGPSSSLLYGYHKGFNLLAFTAVAVAILPLAPGFFKAVQLMEGRGLPSFLFTLYDYSWFVSFFLSFALYALLSRLFPWRQDQRPEDEAPPPPPSSAFLIASFSS